MRADAWMIIAYGRGRDEVGLGSIRHSAGAVSLNLRINVFESGMLRSVAGMLARGAPRTRPRKHPAHTEHREEYKQRYR